MILFNYIIENIFYIYTFYWKLVASLEDLLDLLSRILFRHPHIRKLTRCILRESKAQRMGNLHKF